MATYYINAFPDHSVDRNGKMLVIHVSGNQQTPWAQPIRFSGQRRQNLVTGLPLLLTNYTVIYRPRPAERVGGFLPITGADVFLAFFSTAGASPVSGWWIPFFLSIAALSVSDSFDILFLFGAPARDWTADLLLTKQLLCRWATGALLQLLCYCFLYWRRRGNIT